MSLNALVAPARRTDSQNPTITNISCGLGPYIFCICKCSQYRQICQFHNNVPFQKRSSTLANMLCVKMYSKCESPPKYYKLISKYPMIRKQNPGLCK